jgi:very-short-patch-repair endonuclease
MAHPVGRLSGVFTKADASLAERAARRHGVFTIADAVECGLSAQQIHLRSMRSWCRIHEGVYRPPGVPPSLRGELLAACLAATPPAALSHRSAATLYELPGARDDIIEITCRRWQRTAKPGLVVHESTRFDDSDIVIVDGIPLSTPERVILELAGLRPYADYVERVVQAARRKRLITYDSTLETFRRLARRGVAGVRVTREVLEQWNPGGRPTDSDMEVRLLQILRDHGLPEPVTQFDVLDQYGNLVATTDLALPQWKITIEYDSKQEHSDEFQIAKDNRRRNRIVAAGYRPLTARYDDVRNGGRVFIDEILETARRDGS